MAVPCHTLGTQIGGHADVDSGGWLETRPRDATRWSRIVFSRVGMTLAMKSFDVHHVVDQYRRQAAKPRLFVKASYLPWANDLLRLLLEKRE